MIHDGHRERLRKRFATAPSSFEDHELLELLLFYVVPRKNTNELAHALLKRFGSIKGVIDAGVLSLKSVPDMGENSALFFRVIAETLLRYQTSDFDALSLSSFDTYAELGEYLRNLFVGTENEITYIILFDNAKNLISCKKIAEGYSCGNIISYREMALEALQQNTAAVLLVHNHPHGKPIPSQEDFIATNTANNIFSTFGITFIDHFIVAGDKCMPILSSEKAKLYNQS